MKKFLKMLGLGQLKKKLWQMHLAGKSHEEVFTDIYQNNKWGDSESISGPGSTLKETQHLRGELDKVFAKYNVKSIVDLPCGDYNWFKELHHPFDHYTGCDIVDDLIQKNNEKYGDKKHVFKKIDCLSEQIDDADMIIARDLLIHFCHDDIFKFFNNLRRSSIKYILTSHFVGIEENEKIVTGQGRLVNLTKIPFYFPEPDFWFLEGSQVFDGKWRDMKGMGVWELKTIYEALDKNQANQEAA